MESFKFFDIVILIFSCIQLSMAQRYLVSTVAGSGTAGYLDGQRTTAQFFDPVSLTVDSTGNMYVGDKDTHTIRKISAGTFSVSTFAGSGYPTYQDGQGTQAGFAFTGGVSIDPVSETYLIVADIGNHMIRKIVISTAQVTTLAGNWDPGFRDGQGTIARFNNPTSVTLDRSGNGYVADFLNGRIRKISPSGLVTTFAGSGTIAYLDGQGTVASFFWPHGVFADASANVYVADYGNSRIRKVTPSGLVSTEAGSGNCNFAEGPKYQAHLCNPTAVAIDKYGNFIIVDMANHAIRKVSPDGIMSSVAGACYNQGFGDGEGTLAKFDTPCGVAVDANANIYVTDQYNQRIRKIVATCPPNAQLNSTNQRCRCNTGYFSMDSAYCDTCSEGKFLNYAYDKSCIVGDVNCELADLSACETCIVGKQASLDRLSCQACPIGTYRSLTSQAACQTCPTNSVCSSTAFSCMPGFFLNGTNTCVACPSGTFKVTADNSQCQTCPVNSIPSSGRDQCISYNCPANAVCSGPSNFLCDSGYEVNTAGNGCSKCRASFIKTLPGNAGCVSCPASQEADETRTSCQTCAFGYYKSIKAGVCTICPEVHDYCGSTTFTCVDGYSKNLDETDCVKNSSLNLLNGTANANTILLYSIGGVAVLSVLLFLFVLHLRRKNSVKQNVSFLGKEAPYGSTVSAMEKFYGNTTMDTQKYTAYNDRMTISSNTGTSSYFLSIPAFLQFEGEKDFKTDQFLVQGGGGTVYTGTAFADDISKYGSKIIVKKFNEPQNQNDTDLFYQEISIMYMLRENLNIAKLAGFSVEPYYSLVMKFYQLGSLDKWLGDSENFRTKSGVLFFTKDICEGVKYMHKNGLAHCDLKPQNILLDSDSSGNIFCVITDFGITRVVNKDIIKVRAFRAIAVRGASIAFASPETLMYFNNVEQAKNFNAQRADIYSISVIMFCLVNGGTKPWSSKTALNSKVKNTQSKRT